MEVPSLRLYTHFCHFDLDLDQMRQAAKLLTGEHDYKSFCNVRTQVLDTVRTVYSIDIEKDSNTRLTGKNLFSVKSVLHRHGIDPDSRRGEALIFYVERMSKQNPGGYLQRTLQLKPEFDPSLPDGQEQQTDMRREGGCKSVSELIQGLGLPRPL